LVLHSIGQPGLCALSIRWEDRAAGEAWRLGGDLAAFFREYNTTELVVPVVAPIASEVVYDGFDASAPPKAVAANVWNCDVSLGAASEFVDGRKRFLDLLKQHAEGYVGGTLLRSLRDSRRVAVLHGVEESDTLLSHAAELDNPAIVEFLRQDPVSNFTASLGSVDFSRWEVTLRVTP